MTDTASDFQASIDWGDNLARDDQRRNQRRLHGDRHQAESLHRGRHLYGDDPGRADGHPADGECGGPGGGLRGRADPRPDGSPSVEPAGVTFNDVQVGTFTDSKAGAQTASFSVAINWGNGQTTPGTATFVSSSGGVSLFSVTGTNVYTTPGTYNVTATVNDNVGDSTTIASTAVATGPVLTPMMP